MLLILASHLSANGQVTLVDFIRIKNNHYEEALYFYQSNWKLYRDEAVKRGVIQSYQLLSVPADSAANFHLMLMTVYKDSAQYLASETAFEPILKALRPSGPVLLNDLKPADFRENVFFKAGTTVFTSNDNGIAESPASKEGETAIYNDPELIITQNGDYFMPGQELEMSIIATSESSSQITSISIGGKRQVWKKGHVLTYRIPVELPGSHEIPVTVSFRNNKGQTKRKTYKVAFDVGVPTAAIGLDRMNVLYIGIDNPVSIAASGGGDEKIAISIKGGGGSLTKFGNGKWVIKVTKPTDDCIITLSFEERPVAGFQYRVRQLPLPVGTVGGNTSGDTVLVGAFRAQTGVGAHHTGVPIDVDYEVIGYTVNILNENGEVKSVSNQGAYFNEAVKKLLKEYLIAGRVVTIGNLFVKDANGKAIKLSPLIYHIK